MSLGLFDDEPKPCIHGEMKPHGEIGCDWCAGAMTRVGEFWRKELEWQMNLKPFAGLAGVESIDDAPVSSASDSSAGSPAPVSTWALQNKILDQVTARTNIQGTVKVKFPESLSEWHAPEITHVTVTWDEFVHLTTRAGLL